MTKAKIKQLGAPDPKSGRSELQDYRIVHFATHAVMAWQLAGTDEPGLVLSPPSGRASARDAQEMAPKTKAANSNAASASATPDSEGVLTAGEIAELRLDAEWVILSACNTAASQERGGEAFSGLARAFLYAGAKSVLVSHWSVSTNAAVKITTHAMRALATDRSTTRSEALRRAMQAILEEGEQEEKVAPQSVSDKLHPAYWGAFVQVGYER
jgi:CHAT domain-containing protein